MIRLASFGAACAAIAALALPVTAGASFDPEFSVLSKDGRGHEIPNGFQFHTTLLDPADLDNRVGKGKATCTFEQGARKVHCRVLFHFDGTIGGFGDLLVKGNLGRGDHTLTVADGTGDFGGAVTGKAVVNNINKPKNLIDFHLTR